MPVPPYKPQESSHDMVEGYQNQNTVLNDRAFEICRRIGIWIFAKPQERSTIMTEQKHAPVTVVDEGGMFALICGGKRLKSCCEELHAKLQAAELNDFYSLMFPSNTALVEALDLALRVIKRLPNGHSEERVIAETKARAALTLAKGGK